MLLVIIATLIRLVTAATVELGNDEVYYLTYAQKLQWNYFDHPPMVAIWIRVFTANLSWEQFEVFCRLGSILSCAAATFFLFDAVRRLHSAKAGLYAAVLYNASLYAGIIAGVFILPDSPQMLFWTGALWCLPKIISEPRKLLYWILFAALAGCCIMSKVNGAFLWIGFGCFILFKKRAYFRLPQLYISVFITLLIASPILFWNIANDFITYRFHSERVTVEKFSLNWSGFAREIFGEIFYNNPFNVMIIAGALVAMKTKPKYHNSAFVVYNFIALPMIAILVMVSLFRNTLPHWSGPAYVTLLPLAAVWLAEKAPAAIQKWSAGFALFTICFGIVLINYFPGTLGKKEMEKRGSGDFTLDMYGWRKAGSAFLQLREKYIAAGAMQFANPVVAQKWFTAAHEDHYFCKPAGIEMIGLGKLNDLHHYCWMNEWRMKKADMQNAWCIVPSNESYQVTVTYTPYYEQVHYLATIILQRSGKPARSFTVYRLSGWKGYSSELNSLSQGK